MDTCKPVAVTNSFYCRGIQIPPDGIYALIIRENKQDYKDVSKKNAPRISPRSRGSHSAHAFPSFEKEGEGIGA